MYIQYVKNVKNHKKVKENIYRVLVVSLVLLSFTVFSKHTTATVVIEKFISPSENPKRKFLFKFILKWILALFEFGNGSLGHTEYTRT